MFPSIGDTVAFDIKNLSEQTAQLFLGRGEKWI